MSDVEDLENFDNLESVEDLDILDNLHNVEDSDNCLVDENEDLKKLIEQLEPKVGMEFQSADELYELYKKYAMTLGFPIRKQSAKKNVAGIVRSVTLSCSRGGKHESTSKNPLKPQPSYKIGCTAYLTARLNINGRLEISVVDLDHNHQVSPSKSRFFRCNRRISAHVRHQINLNDQAGIRMNKNFGSLVHEAGGYENISCAEKNCRNLVEESRRLRPGEGDALAIMRYFSKMVAENSGLFFDIELDDEDHLKNVFWADGRSREAYKEFGDVVTFDTTYLTNKYDMPFAPFVGVNHHGQSILLGCGLISREDTETFVWLFRKWLECMGDCAPQGIITDQARAMKNAIEIVFPNTRHRWCLWYIMKKQSEKLGRYTEYEAICSTMKRLVYDVQSPFEFEKQWKEMVNKYVLDNCEWLSELFKERNRWVPCFVKNNFWAGMSTTQRSESMNAFFDGYVHSKTTLKQFVEQYENALRNKVEKETRADADSFSKQRPTATHYMMERQIQEVYTLSKFKEFQCELTGKMYCEIVNSKEAPGVIEYLIREACWLEDGREIPKFFNVLFHLENCDVQCSCQLFQFKGLLCRHALTIYIRHNVNLLPDKYKFNKLQLSGSSQKGKERANTVVVEEEKEEEDESRENILDPLSQTKRGRPKKNRLKPASRRNKKKSDQGDTAQNQAINPLQSQMGFGTSTQESGVFNPYMLQPNMVYPWGLYHPLQQFSQDNSQTSQLHMSGLQQHHMYGWQQFPHQSYSDQRNNP